MLVPGHIATVAATPLVVCDERSTEMDHLLDHYREKHPFETIRIFVPYMDGTKETIQVYELQAEHVTMIREGSEIYR